MLKKPIVREVSQVPTKLCVKKKANPHILILRQRDVASSIELSD